jgi:hypothetical protein
MYQPDHYRVDDLSQMHALMRARPLVALVSGGAEGLYATHLPTVLKDDGSHGVIEFHLARANPHGKIETFTFFRRYVRLTSNDARLFSDSGSKPAATLNEWAISSSSRRGMTSSISENPFGARSSAISMMIDGPNSRFFRMIWFMTGNRCRS